MKASDLSRAELAAALHTPERTLNSWLDGEAEPPGILGALLVVLEKSPKARAVLGLDGPQKKRVRGKPFQRGNRYRFRPR